MADTNVLEITGTVSSDEAQAITSTGVTSDLATVEASTAGDIINGTQTTANPTSDVGSETVINPVTSEEYISANKGLPASTIGTPQTVVSNVLHDYASYTYGLSLHLLTPTDFNNLMGSMNPSYVPTNVLIASAGRYNYTNFIRNPAFNEDFYFEDLKITTVIGMTAQNRSANAIDLSFTIIEPNGFTFINRLLAAATNINAKNYLDMPYMLQIDFFGSSDDGNIHSPISNITKHIPIMLTGIKTKVGAKGAEYRVTAVPYNHKALQQSVAATPTNIQVQAATVQDFFGSGVNVVGIDGAYSAATVQATNNERIETLKRELAKTSDAAAKKDIEFQIGQINDLNQVYTAKTGYSDAINGWYRFLQGKLKRETIDTVSIVLDPEIASARVTVPDKNDVRNMANSSKAEQNAARSSAIGATVGGPKFTEGYYPIPAGTSIDKVIEDVVRNSTYITGQIKDPLVDNPDPANIKLGQPLRWFKVIPKVILGDYDYITGQYSKHYIYYVKTWTVTNKVPVAPMGKASGFVKKYEYMYSGHNSDIIDFNIDFDTLYYIQLTENKLTAQDATSVKRPDRQTAGMIPGQEQDKSTPWLSPPNTAFPARIVHHSRDMQYSSQLRTELDPKKLSGGDLIRDLAGTARGDMLNIKMSILGDPSFIKQDDVFYNITESRTNQLVTKNGSLVMDEGELYVLLFFKMPADYDELTGLHINSGYSYSMFSGVYGITTIENNFSKGKFTQSLNMYRIQNQPAFDDLLGGQTGAVLQYQRIEQQILYAALTPLQNLTRDAAGRLLGSLSSVLSVATAAQQIAQNAQRIATGVITASISSAINKITDVVKNWADKTILTPLENWAKDSILEPLDKWWTEIQQDVKDWFYDTFTSTGDKLYDMFSNASYVDIASFTANTDVWNWVADEMGFETFDVVDPGVLNSIDP